MTRKHFDLKIMGRSDCDTDFAPIGTIVSDEDSIDAQILASNVGEILREHMAQFTAARYLIEDGAVVELLSDKEAAQALDDSSAAWEGDGSIELESSETVKALRADGIRLVRVGTEGEES